MLQPLGITVGLRHGDTTQRERTKQSKNPPNLLVTTPETAQIMLLGSRLRMHLSGLKAVILDEVHDLASSERGAQLLGGLRGSPNTVPRNFREWDFLQRLGILMRLLNGFLVMLWLSLDLRQEQQRFWFTEKFQTLLMRRIPLSGRVPLIR